MKLQNLKYLVLLNILVPATTLAAPTVSDDPDLIERVLNNILKYALWITVVAAILYIVYAGFNFITANGEAEKIERGRKGLLYGVIGLVIALMATSIVSLVTTEVK